MTKIDSAMPSSPHARGRKSVLVLLAHPSIERSTVIRPMAQLAERTDGVTVVDLYAQYPDLQINVDQEQSRLISHDAIIFLHPLYWYSTPAILKQWQDLVLEYGFAYGANGDALAGKIFLSALSAGGPEIAYRTRGKNNFTMRELLQPIEQMANLCGMHYLPPFALFGAHEAAQNDQLDSHLQAWATILGALRDERLDIDAARVQPTLNDQLEDIIVEHAR